MKVLLCTIARMENDYIREWVEYNKNIGFTNICLFDNNYDGEQDFRDVIGDYIDSGFVILKDYRNRTECQLEAYTECYAEYGDKYDWIAFFDSDEFITLVTYGSVLEYLSDPVFNGYVVIKLNWVFYGDNDMLYNDGRGVLERFKYPLPIYHPTWRNNEQNCIAKSIVRGSQKIRLNQEDSGFVFLNPHTTNLYPACNNNGDSLLRNYTSSIPINYSLAHLRHYSAKTAREFCNKLRRGFPDQIFDKSRWETAIVDSFFSINDITPEKVQIFKDVLGVDVSYLLK